MHLLSVQIVALGSSDYSPFEGLSVALSDLSLLWVSTVRASQRIFPCTLTDIVKLMLSELHGQQPVQQCTSFSIEATSKLTNGC